MFTLHDDPHSDLGHLSALATIDEGYQLLDYVNIQDKNSDRWLGQIVGANRNLAILGNSLSPVVLHGLRMYQEKDDVRAIESIQLFDILILRRLVDGQLQLSRVRPMPEAKVNLMSAEELVGFLGVPDAEMDFEGSNVIGLISNVSGLPLCLTHDVLTHHIMINGGTGCGKSNVAGNVIYQGVKLGKCVIVHDVKPDYRLIRDPNSDRTVEKLWTSFEQYNLKPIGMTDVVRVGFYGMCDPKNVDIGAGFYASDFSANFLANLFLSNEPTESKQFDALLGVIQAVRQRKDAGNGDGTFTVQNVLDEVRTRLSQVRSGNSDDEIHESVAKALLRKIRNRIPYLKWLDAIGNSVRPHASGDFVRPDSTSFVQRFNFEQTIRPGRVILIDYSSMESDSDYAVLFSWFLKQAQSYCKRRGHVGVIEIIDEANRLLDNESRHAGPLAGIFNRCMREGRSRDHSLVTLLQNADEVPPGVLNNINSVVLMHQNNRQIAKCAAQTMPDEFAEQSLSLAPGQALVRLRDSRVVLAQMAPSPFDLLRRDNETQAAGPVFDEEEIAL
jgi:DNA helicase HerA-like ATPase